MESCRDAQRAVLHTAHRLTLQRQVLGWRYEDGTRGYVVGGGDDEVTIDLGFGDDEFVPWQIGAVM